MGKAMPKDRAMYRWSKSQAHHSDNHSGLASLSCLHVALTSIQEETPQLMKISTVLEMIRPTSSSPKLNSHFFSHFPRLGKKTLALHGIIFQRMFTSGNAASLSCCLVKENYYKKRAVIPVVRKFILKIWKKTTEKMDVLPRNSIMFPVTAEVIM